MAEEHEHQEIDLPHHSGSLIDHISQNFAQNLNKSFQQSPGDSAYRSPNHGTEHSSEESTSRSPNEAPQQPPPLGPHFSLSESVHNSPHSYPSPSQHHSSKPPQQQSLNAEASRSHGEHDEEMEISHDRQWSLQNSVSALSKMTSAALNFVLPSLPPEIPLQIPSDATRDSKVPRRGRVNFPDPDDETKPSTTSMADDASDSVPRKLAFGSKLLSARYVESPVSPPRKENTVRELFFIAYQTLGVVYGDLGTSPLYVYPTINFKNPTEVEYLGILSLIFWTLTLIGVVKYTLIVLQADDHGEGGTFALYSLLCQHANISHRKGEESSVQNIAGRRLSNMSTLEEKPHHSSSRRILGKSKMAQQVLLFFVMMGTCMLIGDGILTPAISVISAIEGIRTAAPHLSRAVIVVISAIILVLIFLLQRFGTDRVSLLFSPVMAIWFITTALVGVYNIAVHYPNIFKAFSPAYIYYIFRAKGKEAWVILGGTVLCITGTEAMYADMGHFNKQSIQIAFCSMVYPSVLLTYAGQTAYLIRHPDDHSEGFFKMIPHTVYWPMFIVSTLAAIVASQSLITATFSVMKQSVALDYFPRMRIVCTSEDKEGHVYSPEVNYILMILCLAVTFGFRSSATIGNAFVMAWMYWSGQWRHRWDLLNRFLSLSTISSKLCDQVSSVAVVFVMLITTALMSVAMLVIWKCRVLVVLCFFLLFFTVEGIYMSSVVTKVPDGGWLSFVVAFVLTIIMFSWNSGCRAKYKYEMRNQITSQSFETLLREVGNVRVPGICFFYTDLIGGVPQIVQHYVRNVRSLHRVLVFTTVRFLPVKKVLPSERFLVSRTGFDGVYRCVARYGYKDVMKIQNHEFLDQFVDTLKEYIDTRPLIECSTSEREATLSDDQFPQTPVEASIIQQAKEDGAVYVMGKVEMRVSPTTKFMKRIVVGKIYKILNANCRSEVSTMDVPYANYLEIGLLYHI